MRRTKLEIQVEEERVQKQERMRDKKIESMRAIRQERGRERARE